MSQSLSRNFEDSIVYGVEIEERFQGRLHIAREGLLVASPLLPAFLLLFMIFLFDVFQAILVSNHNRAVSASG